MSADINAINSLLDVGPLHLVAALFVSAGTALASTSSPALCRRRGAPCLLRGAGTTVWLHLLWMVSPDARKNYNYLAICCRERCEL